MKHIFCMFLVITVVLFSVLSAGADSFSETDGFPFFENATLPSFASSPAAVIEAYFEKTPYRLDDAEEDVVSFTFSPASDFGAAVGKLYFQAGTGLEYLSATVNGKETRLSCCNYGFHAGEYCFILLEAKDAPLPTVTVHYRCITGKCTTVSVTCTAEDFVSETEQELSVTVNGKENSATVTTTVHRFDSFAKYDEHQHKKLCECGECQMELHQWDKGEVVLLATEEARGIKKFTCLLCGEEATEEYVELSLNENAVVSGLEIREKDDMRILTDLSDGTTVSELKENIDSSDAVFLDQNDVLLTDDSTVGTGAKIRLCTTDGKVLSEVTAIVPGDVDGDGQVKSADALATLRNSVGLSYLGSEFLLAADIDGTGTTSSSDALRILRYSVGLETKLHE